MLPYDSSNIIQDDFLVNSQQYDEQKKAKGRRNSVRKTEESFSLYIPQYTKARFQRQP